MADRPKTVDSLVQELRSGGGADAEPGAFSIDAVRARQQFRDLELPDPHAFVLELVGALVARGATRIDCRADADDVELRADGAPFTAVDFEGLASSHFGHARQELLRSRHQLAVGLIIALQLRPRWIRVTSGDGSTGTELKIRPNGEDKIRPIETAIQGTHIHLKHPFEPALVNRFVANLSQQLPEEQLLKERCRYASVAIVLEGTLISHGLCPTDAMVPMEFTGPDFHGFVGVAHNAEAVSEMRLVQNGVLVATHHVVTPDPPCIAVVNVPRLRRDLSQTDVVQDETYAAVLDAVRAAASCALNALLRQLTESPMPHGHQLDEILDALRVYVRSCVTPAAITAPSVDPIVHLLRHAPVIPLTGASRAGGDRLEDLCCFAPWDIVAVGRSGHIARYLGAGWLTLEHVTQADLMGVWGHRADDVHIVGEKGTLLHLNGRRATLLPQRTEEDLVAVHGAAVDQVYAVGQTGAVLQFNGREWRAAEVGATVHLADVWCHEGGIVVAAGAQGEALVYDGRRWAVHRTGLRGALRSVWGAAPDNVFVVGADGIARFDGERWTTMQTGTDEPLTCVWGRAATDVYAAGDKATLHYNGNRWTRLSRPSAFRCRAITGVTPFDTIAVGLDNGAVTRLDGTAFEGPHVSVHQLGQHAQRRRRVLYVTRGVPLDNSPIAERISRRATLLLNLSDEEDREYLRGLLGRRIFCVNQYLGTRPPETGE